MFSISLKCKLIWYPILKNCSNNLVPSIEMIICLETNPTCRPSDQEVPKTMEEKLCIEKEGLLAKELLEEGFPKGKPPGKGFPEEGLWRYTR
jgi:hypothetical protein